MQAPSSWQIDALMVRWPLAQGSSDLSERRWEGTRDEKSQRLKGDLWLRGLSTAASPSHPFAVSFAMRLEGTDQNDYHIAEQLGLLSCW